MTMLPELPPLTELITIGRFAVYYLESKPATKGRSWTLIMGSVEDPNDLRVAGQALRFGRFVFCRLFK